MPRVQQEAERGFSGGRWTVDEPGRPRAVRCKGLDAVNANTLEGCEATQAVAEAIGWKVYREDMGNGKLGAWICEDPTGLPHSLTRYGFAPDRTGSKAARLSSAKLMVQPKVDMGVYCGEWRAVGLSWEGPHADCTGPSPLVAAIRNSNGQHGQRHLRSR